MLLLLQLLILLLICNDIVLLERKLLKEYCSANVKFLVRAPNNYGCAMQQRYISLLTVANSYFQAVPIKSLKIPA